jgi:hypothetical protein
MFLIAMMSVCLAADADFINIQEGDPAPFTGKLITNEALGKIMAQHEANLKSSDLNLEYEVQKKANEMQLQYDLLDIKYQSEKKMYEEMIAVRDEQLKINRRQDFWRRFATYGGFFIGAATTVGIVYSLNQ